MPESRPLAGLSVLVLEDDYYFADESRQALEEAGATVIGPCNKSEQAITLVRRTHPDCALIDINLGAGPDFGVARELADQHLPMVFVTGYDGSVIPDEFAHVRRLHKPTDALEIVAAVQRLCDR